MGRGGFRVGKGGFRVVRVFGRLDFMVGMNLGRRVGLFHDRGRRAVASVYLPCPLMHDKARRCQELKK